jgi:hypothetical protein
MAITAINPVVTRMMFVAELHRLRAHHALIGDVWGSCEHQNRGQCGSCKNDYSEQTCPSEKIRTAVKDLSHVSVALERSSSL